jgi:hypothetical protein
MKFYQTDEKAKEFLSIEKKISGKLKNIIEKYENSVIVLNNYELSNNNIKENIEFIIQDDFFKKRNKEEEEDEVKFKTNLKNSIIIIITDLFDKTIKESLLNEDIDMKKIDNQEMKQIEELIDFKKLNNQENNENEIERLIDFKKKIKKTLKNHLKVSKRMINRINLIVPFFKFSKNDLFYEINNELIKISKLAEEKKLIKLSWDESLILWLLLKHKPSISIIELLENWVLTFLAQNDEFFNENDHIFLFINESFELKFKNLNLFENYEDDFKIISKL